MSDKAQTVDALLDMTPIVDNRDLVRLAARHLFLCRVKGEESVREVFFPSQRAEARYGEGVEGASAWFNTRDYAVLYVSDALCRLRDEYGLHALIDHTAVEEQLDLAHRSSSWKKVGFALYTLLFPDLVKDENTLIPFRRYMDRDAKLWARRLCERVRDKRWIYRYLQPITAGLMSRDVYNRDMNVLFVKLHLLDPSTVVSTFNYLSKALPDLNLELATSNYLGGPLEWTLVREEVAEAVRAASFPSNVSRLSLGEVEVYHGVRVAEFILLEARRLHLWTGKYAIDNKRTSRLSDRCVLQ